MYLCPKCKENNCKLLYVTYYKWKVLRCMVCGNLFFVRDSPAG